MQRLAGCDSSGVLHYVMGRGIEGKEISQTDTDRQDFVDRLSQLAIKGVGCLCVDPDAHSFPLRSGLVKDLNELKEFLVRAFGHCG